MNQQNNLIKFKTNHMGEKMGRKWKTADVKTSGTGTHRLQNRQLHPQTHVNEGARPPPPPAPANGWAHLDALKKKRERERQLHIKKFKRCASGFQAAALDSRMWMEVWAERLRVSAPAAPQDAHRRRMSRSKVRKDASGAATHQGRGDAARCAQNCLKHTWPHGRDVTYLTWHSTPFKGQMGRGSPPPFSE